MDYCLLQESLIFPPENLYNDVYSNSNTSTPGPNNKDDDVTENLTDDELYNVLKLSTNQLLNRKRNNLILLKHYIHEVYLLYIKSMSFYFFWLQKLWKKIVH